MGSYNDAKPQITRGDDVMKSHAEKLAHAANKAVDQAAQD